MASATLARFFIIFTLLPLITHCIPFVVFHGIGDSCTGKSVMHYTDLLTEWSNAQGYCIEIGNGEWDSWFMPLEHQVEIACEKVKSMSELSQGYNIVGLSQGNIVGRGLIEFCESAPPVKNYISVAGPQAGLAETPSCPDSTSILCFWLKTVIYSKEMQENFAPASYTKFLSNLDAYRKGCKFLPKLNNEFEKNATYKERFSSLQNLVLIMFDEDGTLIPKETSWFGYFRDEASDAMLPPQETKLYIEDWIGLRTLDEAGKVKFVNVSGDHLEITDDDLRKYIVPYLSDQNTLENPVLTKSTRHQPSLSTLDAYGFMRKLGGKQDL